MGRAASSFLALALVLAARVIAGAQAATPCDRACLESMLDRYVEALVARAPARLPLAAAAVFTESTWQEAMSRVPR